MELSGGSPLPTEWTSYLIRDPKRVGIEIERIAPPTEEVYQSALGAVGLLIPA